MPPFAQSHRVRAFCKIIVDGRDVTAAFDPYLISVTVIDKEGGEVDTCSLELDDRNAQLAIPPDGAPVSVRLGWRSEGTRAVFDGVVSSVESGFSRKGGGRRLWIEATGADMKGPGKSPIQMSMGEGQPPDGPAKMVSMSEVFGKFAKQAGLSANIGSMGGQQKDYWYINSSFHHWGLQQQRELGAIFKISGNQVSLTSATEFFAADGTPTAIVAAEWGDNLIAWRIKPFTARPQYSGAKSQHFNILSGAWKSASKSIGGETPFGGANATAMQPGPQANANNAGQIAGGLGAESERERGTGWVLFNGEPQARGGGRVQITGARPGVDGTYRIKEAQHVYTRGGGYTTRCDVAQPSLDASTYKQWWDPVTKPGQPLPEKPTPGNPVVPPIEPLQNVTPSDDVAGES